MSEMNITLSQANAWIAKVEDEFVECRNLLKRVNNCIEECEKDDDTIYRQLVTTGKAFEGAWDNLGKGYAEVVDILKNQFRESIERVQEAVEMVQNLGKKPKS